MADLLRAWRERGWQEVNADAYASLWNHYGGSVMTWPPHVAGLAALAVIPTRSLAFPCESAITADFSAGIATWGPYLALSRQALKRYGKRDCFDLGNAEVIVPTDPQRSLSIRYRMRYVSEINLPAVRNLKPQKESLTLAREPEEYNKKFLYNQRRELRLFEQAGGRVQPICDLSSEQISATYSDLFEKRWGFPVPAKSRLAEVVEIMRPYLAGSVLSVDGRPAAIQILYQVESPSWISVEYINGGVDPAFQSLSPGSVLTYLNTQAAWAHARQLGKPLRYSFGRADRDYKLRWCRLSACYRT